MRKQMKDNELVFFLALFGLGVIVFMNPFASNVGLAFQATLGSVDSTGIVVVSSQEPFSIKDAVFSYGEPEVTEEVDENGTRMVTTEYPPSSKGKVTEIEEYDKNGTLVSKIVVVETVDSEFDPDVEELVAELYDAKGRLIRTYRYKSSDSSEEEIESEYDEKGNKVSFFRNHTWAEMNKKGNYGDEINEVLNYTYGENGELKNATKIKTRTKPDGDVIVQEYEYDPKTKKMVLKKTTITRKEGGVVDSEFEYEDDGAY